MSQKQYALFDDRFLESFAGTAIVSDPKVAIIELVANAWDAGATTVEINWPSEDGEKFSIVDNGHGMSDRQFNKRFRTLAYNRSSEQGLYAEIPKDLKSLIGKRPTFGKNGKGRLGAFAFGETFCVRTWRDSIEILYKVSKDFTHTLAFQKQGESITRSGHGTEIFNDFAIKPYLNAKDARREIGMRFLTDPHFNVFVNGIKITFQDIPENNLSNIHSNPKEDWISIGKNDAVDISLISKERDELKRNFISDTIKASFTKFEKERRLSSTPIKANGEYDSNTIISDLKKFTWMTFYLSEELQTVLDTTKLPKVKLLTASLRGAPFAAMLGMICNLPFETIDHFGPKHKVFDTEFLKRIEKGTNYIYIGDFAFGGTEIKLAKTYTEMKSSSLKHAVVLGNLIEAEHFVDEFNLYSLISLNNLNREAQFSLL